MQEEPRTEVRRVPSLHLSEEKLAKVAKEDRNVVSKVYQIGAELALHQTMTAEEAPFEYEITPYPDQFYYELWFLFPPGRQKMKGTELGHFLTIGFGCGGLIGYEDLEWGIEEDERRLYLIVNVLMNTSPVRRAYEDKVIISQKMEVRPSSSLFGAEENQGRLSLGLLFTTLIVYASNAVKGIAVRKHANGTLFSNVGSPRNNRRPKSPVKRQRDNDDHLLPPAKRSLFE